MPHDAPAQAPTPAPVAAPAPNGAAKAPPAAAAEPAPSRPVVIDAPQPKQPRIAPHFIALREKERKIAAREAAVAEVEQLRALREKDPWEFAQKLGFSARDVAKRAVDEGKETPEQVALREMRAELEATRKRLDERDSKEQTAAEKDARAADVAAIGRALAAAPGEFLALEDEDAAEITDAFEAIYLRDYEPLGESLTAENVRAIFKTLDGDLRSFYETKAGRLKPLDRAPEAAPTANPEKRPRQHVLSNLDAAERAARAPQQKPTSREERLERALAKVK